MNQTAAMRVESTTFLIEKLAADCSPNQYVRELTQNSFEAILRHRESGWQGEGIVEWDLDWNLVENEGVYKLQISDNGCGMTGEQIEKYINQLSSSGGIQGIDANYGIGAKITAGVENPYGLVYKSWVNGQGVLAHLWKDQTEGVYGLKKREINGEYRSFAPISDQAKSTKIISNHGTTVTLLGKSKEQNTYYFEHQKQKWLIAYLNSRYFKLPENIALKVRDFSNARPEDWPKSHEEAMTMGTGGSQMRTIQGMSYYLNKYSDFSGTVDLTKAKMHWWILQDNLSASGGIFDEKYHVAALYQSELYDYRRHSEARSLLVNAGITFGWQRVVLYLEPNTEQLDITTDTSRKSLLIKGEFLPWEEWVSEFRSKLPIEIKNLVDAILSNISDEDNSESIKKRLKELENIFKLDRYRYKKLGILNVSGELPGDKTGEGHEPAHDKGKKQGEIPRGENDLYAAYIADEGMAGEKVGGDNKLPRINWISLENGSRAAGDLEDQAARYSPSENMIFINDDFRFFEAYLEALKEEYPHAGPEAIKKTFKYWIEMQLTEVILGIQALQGSPSWSDLGALEKATSEEALTACVMPRYSNLSQMRRDLSRMVGASNS